MQTEQIIFTLRGEQHPDGWQRIRLTIRTCNALDMARHTRMIREINTWFQERHGKSIAQLTDAEMDELEANNELAMFDLGTRRARLLCALDSVELCDGEGEWQEGALPWPDLETFATQIPQALLNLWDSAVHECNPGLFGVIRSDDEKKSGVFSATWLTKSYVNSLKPSNAKISH